GQAGWRLRVNGEPPRRAGDNDPDSDGALVAPRHDPRRSPLLSPRAVYHSGWRFTLRAGSSGWRRQPARNRPARGGHLPRLGPPLGRSWTAVANEVSGSAIGNTRFYSCYGRTLSQVTNRTGQTQDQSFSFR